MNNKPYGYIYIILIPTSEGKRFYVGQKKGSNIKETYWGSGTKVKDWFKKHTGHSSKCCDKNIAESLGVRRKIIGWAKTKECLCCMEKIYISLILNNPLFWNINIGGHGGSIKGRILKKGRVFTEEHRRKIAESRKGTKTSAEVRQKLSMARKGKKLGPMSEIARQHISESAKHRKTIGLIHWYNNGEKEICSFICPVGWTKGRLTPVWNKGQKGLQVCWHKGQKWSEEVKNKMRTTKKQRASVMSEEERKIRFGHNKIKN